MTSFKQDKSLICLNIDRRHLILFNIDSTGAQHNVHGNHRLNALLSGTLLLATTLPCLGKSLDITLQPGQARENFQWQEADQLHSAMNLAVHSELVKLAVDYNVRARMDDQGVVDNTSTEQRLGAIVRSSRLDQLLGGTSQLKTESVLQTGTERYTPRLSPTFSRPVLDIGTLDVQFGYLLSGNYASTTQKRTKSYSFGLRGSLPGGQVKWRGAYSTSSTFRGQAAATLNVENFKLQSEYRIAPKMKLQLFANHKQRTRLAASREIVGAERRYGAGISWQPSKEYSLDLKVDRQERPQAGEQALLQSGSLSWFPSNSLALSLNYGDQLIDGERGILLSTELEFDGL